MCAIWTRSYQVKNLTEMWEPEWLCAGPSVTLQMVVKVGQCGSRPAWCLHTLQDNGDYMCLISCLQGCGEGAVAHTQHPLRWLASHLCDSGLVLSRRWQWVEFIGRSNLPDVLVWSYSLDCQWLAFAVWPTEFIRPSASATKLQGNSI